jgi:hypothetical protein
MPNSRTKTRVAILKVSEKGAISMYGMGRFPVTPIRNSGSASRECDGDRDIYPRQRGQAENEGVGAQDHLSTVPQCARQRTFAIGSAEPRFCKNLLECFAVSP